ncbi:hypothetical protein [Streptomyces sp. NPDC059247]|uniref:hypothetical protein n=1 Tax=Streptomyces sp. NPDC059247 TaxID=3346790 RepID=UPI0036AF7E43
MKDPLSISADETAGTLDLHCNLYVDLELPQVAEDLILRLPGTTATGELRYRSLELYVAHNDYRTDGGDPSNFLQWGTVIECDPTSGTPSDQVVSDVRDVISSLQTAGYSVEADCLYEGKLKS